MFQMVTFPSPTKSPRGFFFHLHCENLIELLEVRLTKMQVLSSWLNLLRVFNSHCPHWAFSSFRMTEGGNQNYIGRTLDCTLSMIGSAWKVQEQLGLIYNFKTFFWPVCKERNVVCSAYMTNVEVREAARELFQSSKSVDMSWVSYAASLYFGAPRTCPKAEETNYRYSVASRGNRSFILPSQIWNEYCMPEAMHLYLALFSPQSVICHFLKLYHITHICTSTLDTSPYLKYIPYTFKHLLLKSYSNATEDSFFFFFSFLMQFYYIF